MMASCILWVAAWKLARETVGRFLEALLLGCACCLEVEVEATDDDCRQVACILVSDCNACMVLTYLFCIGGRTDRMVG